MVALNEQPQHRHRAKAPSIHAALPCLTSFTDAYRDGHAAAAEIGRFSSANRRGGHKSVESVKSVDHFVPPVPMSKMRKLRSRLRRRGVNQSADASGNVVQTYHYDGSGNALGFTPTSSITPYLYDQQFFDIISGQYYMRARNYDPATGTFTQQDSINLQPGDTANANFYLYAGADPVSMFDPSGHDLMETLGSLAINSILGGIGGGAVIGTYFHFTGGSFSGGFGAGFVFGGSLPFAIATGRVLEALTAGLLQGGISAAVDAVIAENRGGIYGAERTSQDFLTGFSYGFASATWSQLFSPEEEWQLAGSALIGAFSSLLKSYAQHIAMTGNLGDFSEREIVDVFSNALSAGATSALLRAGLGGSLPEVPGAIAQEVKIFATIVLGVEGDLIGAAFQEAVKLLG